MNKVAIDEMTGCWNWMGARYRSGYGAFNRTHRGPTCAHRVAYELLVGLIPDGLTIDHLFVRQQALREPRAS